MRGVTNGEPDGTVTEVGDQVQPAAKCFDVPGDDFEGGHFAMFDLRHSGNAHAQRGSDVLLRKACLPASVGELITTPRGSPLLPIGDVPDLAGVPEAARVEQVLVRRPGRRWAAVVQRGQLIHDHADMPFIRTALT